MIDKTFNLNTQHLAFQRNAFLALSVFLTTAVIVLSISLTMKSERIIVVPQVIGDTIWAKGGKVSESYLREQAQVVNMLFLSKTPSSAKEQNDSLLKITAPNFYGVLKKNLNEEENLLFNQGASYLFLPSKTKVDASQMMVITEGERSTYISGKLLSTVKEKYTYRFTFNGTRLLLSGVAREEVGGV